MTDNVTAHLLVMRQLIERTSKSAQLATGAREQAEVRRMPRDTIDEKRAWEDKLSREVHALAFSFGLLEAFKKGTLVHSEHGSDPTSRNGFVAFEEKELKMVAQAAVSLASVFQSVLNYDKNAINALSTHFDQALKDAVTAMRGTSSDPASPTAVAGLTERVAAMEARMSQVSTSTLDITAFTDEVHTDEGVVSDLTKRLDAVASASNDLTSRVIALETAMTGLKDFASQIDEETATATQQAASDAAASNPAPTPIPVSTDAPPTSDASAPSSDAPAAPVATQDAPVVGQVAPVVSGAATNPTASATVDTGTVGPNGGNVLNNAVPVQDATAPVTLSVDPSVSKSVDPSVQASAEADPATLPPVSPSSAAPIATVDDGTGTITPNNPVAAQQTNPASDGSGLASNPTGVNGPDTSVTQNVDGSTAPSSGAIVEGSPFLRTNAGTGTGDMTGTQDTRGVDTPENDAAGISTPPRVPTDLTK